MSFWAQVVKEGAAVDYCALPEYILTVRRAVLVPGSGSAALFVESDNFDGQKTRALVAILRPNGPSEQVELNLTVGFGEKLSFEIEPLESKKEGDGQKKKPSSVSLVGFLHPFSSAFATGEEDEEDEGEEDVS
jgi:hypothetical protein